MEYDIEMKVKQIKDFKMFVQQNIKELGYGDVCF